MKRNDSGDLTNPEEELKEETSNEESNNIENRIDPNPYLCLYHAEDVPEWINDNIYLPKYHRPITPCFFTCFKSIFRIHSETGNIWTHLIGFGMFFIAIIGFYSTLVNSHIDWLHSTENKYENEQFSLIDSLFIWFPTKWGFPLRFRNNIIQLKMKYNQIKSSLSVQEHIVILVFFSSGLFCLAASTIYHTFACYSFRVYRILAQLDYMGILFLIIGSCGPPMYYGYYCFGTLQVTYLAVVYALGFGLGYFIMFGNMSRDLRSYSFVVLGLVVALPMIHFVILHGLESSISFFNVDLLLIMGFFYISGMLLYTYRLPERFHPSFFNVWFQSHQILHIFVVIALFIHLRFVHLVVHYRIADAYMCSI